MPNEQIPQCFSDAFIQGLPDDKREALLAVLNRFEDWSHRAGDALHGQPRVRRMEALGVLTTLLREIDPPLVKDMPDSTSTHVISRWASNVREHIQTLIDQDIMTTASERTLLLLPGSTAFEFPPDDVDRLHELISHARKIVDASDELEERHRRRILGALDRLSKEVGVRMSNLDRFYGVIEAISTACARSAAWSWDHKGEIIETANAILDLMSKAKNVFFGLPEGTKDTTLLALPEPEADDASQV